jgi:alkylation response protein AidB-like acyl-CoA dehydrogenase
MTAALNWLKPLRTSIPEIDESAWKDLEWLSSDLQEWLRSAPSPADRRQWSAWLLRLRRRLAERGHHAPEGPGRELWQAMAQFMVGFHDLDLRDCIGPGHGAMILAGAIPETAARWQDRLLSGELVGIAATERHGGSRIREITTRAWPVPGGQWLLAGEKCWVARLAESSGFVVFFQAPVGGLTAAIIEASRPGLERDVVDASGLGGSSWGVLRLREVTIDPRSDLIGGPGAGLRVFHEHFAGFRPLVTATALGTAAGVHTSVRNALAARIRTGMVPRIRDNALITLGRTHAEINAALLGSFTAGRLAAARHTQAGLVTHVSKAFGVDTAVRVVGELGPLIGAAGFQQTHPISKARRDLDGLLFADGIHDTLYRSAGRVLLEEPDQQTTSG